MWSPNRRSLAIVKSFQWYQQLHPESKVLTNFFDLEWQTSSAGIIIHLIQVLDDGHLSVEVRNEIDKDVKEFKAFFKIFTFITAYSVKFYCPTSMPLKKKKWRPEQIIKKICVGYEYADGHGGLMTDFGTNQRGSRRHQTDWITMIEAGDERTRGLLNELFEPTQ